ncbi:MAG: class I SAM-dependent methyltransferase [Desulfarculus sp.]|nr:class I SAM-dependent methyltransferase [Desulfarculus sp.]
MTRPSTKYDPAGYEQVDLIDAPGLLGWIGQKRLRLVTSLLAGAFVPQGPSRTLDIGCGYGEILAAAPGHFKVGLDVHPAALQRASGRARGASLVRAMVTPLPFLSDSFDYVVCSEVLEHLENPQELAREIVRVTKPGGAYCVTVPNEWTSTLGRFLLGVKPAKSPAHKQWFTPGRLAALFPTPPRRRVNIPWGPVPFLVSTNLVALFGKEPA